MSNAIFPTLPGLQYPIGKRPVTSTHVDETVSGREFAWSAWTYPRISFTLQYEFLRDAASWQEVQALAGFFMARGGRLDDFLLYDADDQTVTAQQFGTGDGASTDFALTASIMGYAMPVGYGTPSNVKNSGVTTTAYSLLSNRIIRFNTAPTAGAPLLWTGTQAYRVRFDVDEISDLRKFMAGFWSTGQINLITRKP